MADSARGPQSYFPSIEAKFGQPMQFWFDILGRHPDKAHMEMVSILTSEHDMGHGHANAVVAFYRADKGI